MAEPSHLFCLEFIQRIRFQHVFVCMCMWLHVCCGIPLEVVLLSILRPGSLCSFCASSARLVSLRASGNSFCASISLQEHGVGTFMSTLFVDYGDLSLDT